MKKSPQIENGFTRIANELLEELSKHHLSGQEYQVFLAVLRKTYGYHKKKDKISYTQLAKATGINVKNLPRVLTKLVDKGILKKEGSNINILGINKHYWEWKGILKNEDILKKEGRVSSRRKGEVPSISRITKERKKNNKRYNKQIFNKFWNLYDKKIDRKKCLRKWKRLSKKDKRKIFETLPDYIKATPDKKFRKNPSTYLNNKSWENEIIKRKKQNEGTKTLHDGTKAVYKNGTWRDPDSFATIDPSYYPELAKDN